jgi:NADPH2:quinone reductase
MRAIRVHACGGPEALRYDEVQVPVPQAGEALVEIAAAGVNFIDVQHRPGRYKPPALPFTLGSEAAGVVTAVGAGVTEVAVGDRVAYAMVLGAYADYAVVPARRLVKVPAAVDLQTAAAVTLQGLTAHYLTHST